MSGLAVLFGLWGLVITIFWLVVAWRAMAAHERLAAALERIAQKDSLPKG